MTAVIQMQGVSKRYDDVLAVDALDLRVERGEIYGFLGLNGSAALTLALMTPVALLASAGHGYLLPLGWAILTLFVAQIMAATGWGPLFPWSIPPLFGGLAGPEGAQLEPVSYLLVALTSAAGFAATFWWWRHADQTR